MNSIVLATAVVNKHVYAVLIEPASDTARVSSKSNPASTHRITRDGCDCTYARYHAGRACSHLRALAAVQQERRTAVSHA